jgi:hypothetical protein
MELKIYIAGKVSKESVFGTNHWRDAVCETLEDISGHKIINLDPAKDNKNASLDESDGRLIFGRDCYMIKQSDLVIVILTDDISVGGSQEMLIAKYFHKPLLGIAAQGGKFIKDEKEMRGKTFKNWVHPFVMIPCDELATTIEEAGYRLRAWFTQPLSEIKDLSVIDQALSYYQSTHLEHDL